jgi:Protein of unknown function (DUF669)
MSTVLNEAFDVETEEGTPPRELVPAGRYKAAITAATVGRTKTGRGDAVSLTWSIEEGDYEKRLLFQNILIQHDSEDAQRFGRQKFKDVCVACCITTSVTDLEVLLYKPCMITVKIRKDVNGEYPDRNEVSRVMPLVASWNAPKKETTVPKEASETPKAFKAESKDMNDEIPF